MFSEPPPDYSRRLLLMELNAEMSQWPWVTPRLNEVLPLDPSQTLWCSSCVSWLCTKAAVFCCFSPRHHPDVCQRCQSAERRKEEHILFSQSDFLFNVAKSRVFLPYAGKCVSEKPVQWAGILCCCCFCPWKHNLHHIEGFWFAGDKETRTHTYAHAHCLSDKYGCTKLFPNCEVHFWRVQKRWDSVINYSAVIN